MIGGGVGPSATVSGYYNPQGDYDRMKAQFAGGIRSWPGPSWMTPRYDYPIGGSAQAPPPSVTVHQNPLANIQAIIAALMAHKTMTGGAAGWGGMGIQTPGALAGQIAPFNGSPMSGYRQMMGR